MPHGKIDSKVMVGNFINNLDIKISDALINNQCVDGKDKSFTWCGPANSYLRTRLNEEIAKIPDFEKMPYKEAYATLVDKFYNLNLQTTDGKNITVKEALKNTFGNSEVQLPSEKETGVGVYKNTIASVGASYSSGSAQIPLSFGQAYIFKDKQYANMLSSGVADSQINYSEQNFRLGREANNHDGAHIFSKFINVQHINYTASTSHINHTVTANLFNPSETYIKDYNVTNTTGKNLKEVESLRVGLGVSFTGHNGFLKRFNYEVNAGVSFDKVTTNGEISFHNVKSSMVNPINTTENLPSPYGMVALTANILNKDIQLLPKTEKVPTSLSITASAGGSNELSSANLRANLAAHGKNLSFELSAGATTSSTDFSPKVPDIFKGNNDGYKFYSYNLGGQINSGIQPFVGAKITGRF